MNLQKSLFLLFISLYCLQVHAQLTEAEKELVAPSLSLYKGINFSGEFNLSGFGTTEDKLPFWLYHNQRGRVSPETNLSSWISGRTVNFFSRNSFLIMGGGFLFDDAAPGEFMIDELYAHFQNQQFYITAGRKQQPELYNGLSSSNRSILWSINARPVPGIVIGTTKPLFISGDEEWGVEGSWGEYFLGKDRYVEGARLHHKNIRLVYKKGDWQAKAGIQHYAQWGGNHPVHGKNPSTFEDYISIFMGLEGGAGATYSDQLNALGNHLGGYEIYLQKEFEDFSLQLFYNHLFEDRSGMRWRNKIDGRYGIYFEKLEKENYINALILEIYYTEHQSHTINAEHKWDNFLNNGYYKSGWTYEGRVIGAPFFTVDPAEGPGGLGIINNKFRAYHFGMGGFWEPFQQLYPYKLMLSYSYNDGTAFERFRPKQDVFYVNYEMKFWDEFVELRFQFGAEYNSFASPIYGAGIHLQKEF